LKGGIAKKRPHKRPKRACPPKTQPRPCQCFPNAPSVSLLVPLLLPAVGALNDHAVAPRIRLHRLLLQRTARGRVPPPWGKDRPTSPVALGRFLLTGGGPRTAGGTGESFGTQCEARGAPKGPVPHPASPAARRGITLLLAFGFRLPRLAQKSMRQGVPRHGTWPKTACRGGTVTSSKLLCRCAFNFADSPCCHLTRLRFFLWSAGLFRHLSATVPETRTRVA
jgi:hypothetical protein